MSVEMEKLQIGRRCEDYYERFVLEGQHPEDEEIHTLGSIISADQTNFVRYSKYGSTYTITKGICAEYEDSYDVYKAETQNQEKLASLGYAPRLIIKDICVIMDGTRFALWISEDCGLPVGPQDVPAVNAYLDELYDRGIILTPYTPYSYMFVKGFDGKIRATDFKNTEFYTESIGKHNRKYLQI